MKYIGYRCQACDNVFTEQDDVVVCPICGAPHHRECWLKDNSCAKASEHQQGFTWSAPELPKQEPKREQSEEARSFRRDYTDYNEMPDIMCKNGEKAVPCPHCGSLNYEKDMYCMRCHMPLKQEQGQNGERLGQNEPFDSQNSDVPPFVQTQVDDFNRYGGVDPDATVDDIPIREYSDYVGGKAPGKIIRRLKLMERFGRKTAPTIPPLILGPIWFFYRKMVKDGLILLLIWALLGVGSSLLALTRPLQDYYRTILDQTLQMAQSGMDVQALQEAMNEASNIYQYAERTQSEMIRENLASVLQYVQLIALPIASSLLAMPLYRKKAKKDILDARQINNSMEGYRMSLMQMGGTSVGLAVLGLALMAVGFLLSMYLPLLLTFVKG